jgi:hypothetical protein
MIMYAKDVDHCFCLIIIIKEHSTLTTDNANQVVVFWLSLKQGMGNPGIGVGMQW